MTDYVLKNGRFVIIIQGGMSVLNMLTVLVFFDNSKMV